MKCTIKFVALLCALAPAAGAQFSLFPWTLDNPSGQIGAFVSATAMGFDGSLGGLPSGISAKYSTLSPVDASVSVHLQTWPLDGVCGSTVSYGESGQLHSFTDCHFNGNLTFSVHAGGTIIFGYSVFNGSFPGDAYFTSFSYRPFWLPLAGSLAGSTGTPAMTGHGVLKAGEPFSIEVSNAAPAAATALVVGFGLANLPFKGGVLVPAPTLILPGFATDGLGGLSVGSTWNSPPGTSFIVQAWIADSGAPKGFAASNAVQAFGF